MSAFHKQDFMHFNVFCMQFLVVEVTILILRSTIRKNIAFIERILTLDDIL